MALIAARLNECSDRYIISLFPHLHTPFPPFSPSLISLVVSVDVKHHVYLLHSPFLLVLRFIQPDVKGVNETLKINTKTSQGPVLRIFTREVDSFLNERVTRYRSKEVGTLCTINGNPTSLSIS